jgi:hypothetical protein
LEGNIALGETIIVLVIIYNRIGTTIGEIVEVIISIWIWNSMYIGIVLTNWVRKIYRVFIGDIDSIAIEILVNIGITNLLGIGKEGEQE